MANYCFVRHGQTDWNIEGRWQGHSDVSLNETGEEQARNAAEILKGTTFTAIYSSDLKRAYATAAAINANHQLPIQIDKRLREQHLGNWEGLGVKEVPGLFPDLWRSFTDDPVTTVITGGESLKDLADRMREFHFDTQSKHGSDENILVVAHGLSLAVLICMLEDRPFTEAYKLIPANASPIFHPPLSS